MSDGDFAITRQALARRATGRLPEKAATAAAELLHGSLAASPHKAGTPLRPRQDGLHSARRSGYQIIYRIDDNHHRTDVLAIEHRSDIYRPRQL